MHMVVDGHDMPVNAILLSTSLGLDQAEVPPVGLDEVTTPPRLSATTHIVGLGHETPTIGLMPSTSAGALHAEELVPAGVVDVTMCPLESPATHSDVDGHEIAFRLFTPSTPDVSVQAPATLGVVEYQALPEVSIAIQSPVDGQDIASSGRLLAPSNPVADQPAPTVREKLAEYPAAVVPPTMTHRLMDGQAVEEKALATELATAPPHTPPEKTKALPAVLLAKQSSEVSAVQLTEVSPTPAESADAPDQTPPDRWYAFPLLSTAAHVLSVAHDTEAILLPASVTEALAGQPAELSGLLPATVSKT